MTSGYGFRVLNIDLSSGESWIEEIYSHVMSKFLGGASLGAYLLFPDLTVDLDPLSPESPLLILTGPLTGTAGPAVGRFVVCAKSPATGLWGESNCGGYFGSEMRKAGYDGVLIKGRASSPVYIWMNKGKVEIRPAGELWGSADPYETQQRIRAECSAPNARVACIGQAGEAKMPFALILCDHGRVAGRTGMGAVMGAKNLKAIAVKGTQSIPIMNEKEYQTLRSSINRELRDNNFSRVARELGTAASADYFDYLREMPKYYFSRATFDGVYKISGASLAESILDRVSACHACVIACGRVVRLDGGNRQKGPEYETIAGFGPNLGIDDLNFITRMGGLCDHYGMDAISTSNVIGLSFMLAQEGVLDAAQSDGLRLEWGNMESVEQLVHQIGKGEGFGAELGMGARAFASHLGAQQWAVQVNGLEVPYHDPRGASGTGLVYATSPRGACHNQGDYFLVDTFSSTYDEVGVTAFDRLGGAEKAANVARHQDWRSVTNALVMCFFANVEEEQVLALVNAATGFDLSLEEIMEVGERSWNLKRLINVQMGLKAEHDRLPDLLLKAHQDVDDPYILPFDEMLSAYYQARDWDPESGMPKLKTLERLGLTNGHKATSRMKIDRRNLESI